MLEWYPLKNLPLASDPDGVHQRPELFRRLKCMGRPLDQISFLQKLGGYQIMFTFNSHHPVLSYTKLQTRAEKASQIHLVNFVGHTFLYGFTNILWVYSFADNFC